MLLGSSRRADANPSVGLDWALESIAGRFEARAAVLWSCNGGWNVAAYYGYDGALRCPAAQSSDCLCRAAAISGQTLTNTYVPTLAATVGQCPYVVDCTLETFIGSPVAFKESTVGVVALFFDTSHRISPAALSRFDDAIRPAGTALADLQTARAIFSAKTEWENAVDTIATPVAVLDEDMSVRRANRPFARWIGGGWNRIVGHKCFDLATSFETEPTDRALRREIADDTPARVMVRARPSAETSTAVCYPRKDAAGAVVGSVCMVDIEQKPSVSNQIVAIQRAATLGRLAAELAHELGAPLSTVAGHAELLLSQSLAEPVKKTIGIICQETGRAQRIVKRMLEFGRQQPIRQDEVSLNDVAQAGMQLYAHPSVFHGVSLRSELAENLPPVVADFDQMLQVVLNFLANAYRAVRQSEGLREVTVFTRQEGSRIQLGVTDSGPGIDPDIVSRVFDPFFTTHAGDEGTGLGLAVCRKIAESHEGTISVDTVVGKGSTFTLDLPAAISESADPAGPSNEPGFGS